MSLKVLLADDSMTAQNMGKKILAESGYDVTTVSNGAAAVKKIAEVKPDVVILDIYMPGYTGLEVCERVRANMDTANLPVLLTVGKMEPYRAEDGAKVRADGVIVKPFEATDLLAVVKKMAEKVSTAARHVAPEPEPEPAEEEVGQPEPAMPAAVEVPSEMAAAPALAMEEFNTAPAEIAEFKPTIEWTTSPELPVEQTGVSTTPEPPQIAEIPWSFDQAATPVEPQAESTPVPAAEPGSEVEFTSAPSVDVKVQQAEGLEAGLEAPPTGNFEVTTDPALTSPLEMTEFATSFAQTNPEPPASDEVIAELPTIEAPAESAWDGWAHAQPEPVPEATVEAAPEAVAETAPESSWAAPAVEETSHIVEESVPETKPVIDDFEAKVAAAMAGFSVERQAEPPVESRETAPAEALASPNVVDFEARVAAAMSGFATEPVEAAHEIVKDAHAQPAEIEAVADDFEARVAAAMSGFATEPIEPEPATEEAHAQRMAEAHAEPTPEETPVETTPTPTIAQEDFDSRLAQALSAFDTAPEMSLHEEPSAIAPTEAPVEMHAKAPAVQLNETTVLPHEATLSLEEEMKEAFARHANDAAGETVAVPPQAPVTDFVSQPEQEYEAAPVEVHAAQPEIVSEFDSAHEAPDSAPPQLPEVAVAAFAAAASVEPVEPAKSGSEKFADAVQRAIERLKPQLIAEIVKELKGE